MDDIRREFTGDLNLLCTSKQLEKRKPLFVLHIVLPARWLGRNDGQMFNTETGRQKMAADLSHGRQLPV